MTEAERNSIKREKPYVVWQWTNFNWEVFRLISCEETFTLEMQREDTLGEDKWDWVATFEKKTSQVGQIMAFGIEQMLFDVEAGRDTMRYANKGKGESNAKG